MMPKMRFCFVCMSMIMCILSVSGQQNTPPLRLEWEILTNEFKGIGPVINRLTISNESMTVLGASGWTIYFNGHGVQTPEDSTEKIKVQWINGDYAKIEPGKNWIPLAPGQQVTVRLRLSNLLNVRNIPTGLYLVSTDYPQGLPLKVDVLPNPSIDSLEVKLAAEIFDKNQRVSRELLGQRIPAMVFPTPQEAQYTEHNFLLDSTVQIQYDTEFISKAVYLQDQLAHFLTRKPELKSGLRSSETVIQLKWIDGLADEAYHLSVDRQKIQILASHQSGMFYGIQSLKALLPIDGWRSKQSEISVQGARIKDAPRFSHRAFMMDVARNFQPKDQVLKILDLLAFYKINVLHFHLTDDEGWRLEIPGLPELTAVGGRRGHTLDERDNLIPSYGSGPVADAISGSPFASGHYSRADFIEILKYAADRHIQVIPEIETPGHARAAIKAMESRYHRLRKEGDEPGAWQYRLADPDDRSQYRSAQAWTDNIMNVAMPSVYAFLEKVFDEVIAMYQEAGVKLTTIHIGGDEVPNGVWEQSPLVRAFMSGRSTENLSVASLDEVDDLWYYYLDRVADILHKRGLYASGWEEIGMKKAEVNGRKTMVVDPILAKHNFHVDVWNNVGNQVDLAYRLANAGYPVVLSNVTNFYMDLAYNTSYYENGHQWGGHVDLDKTFRFVPFDYYKSLVDNRSGVVQNQTAFSENIHLTDEGKKKIIGIQAPLWSEFILGTERLEYMLLPKLLGFAERAWSAERLWEVLPVSQQQEEKYRIDWTRFLLQVGQRELPRLDNAFGGFHYRIPTPGIRFENGKWHANVQIPDFSIRFTRDGSEPTSASPLYQDPVSIEEGEKLVFKVFNQNGRGSRSVRAN